VKVYGESDHEANERKGERDLYGFAELKEKLQETD
jgi:hypothetical protein